MLRFFKLLCLKLKDIFTVIRIFKDKCCDQVRLLFSKCVVMCRSRAEVEPPLPETPPAPAPAPPRADELEPGSQRQYSLDDFELIRVIGRGSYAKVNFGFIAL